MTWVNQKTFCIEEMRSASEQKRLENELRYRAHNEGSLSVIEKKLEFVLQEVEESHTNFPIRDGRVVSVIPKYSTDHHVSTVKL